MDRKHELTHVRNENFELDSDGGLQLNERYDILNEVKKALRHPHPIRIVRRL
jgi:hypothetical protein